MKSVYVRIIFVVSLMFSLSPVALAQSKQADAALTNAAVVKLAKAGFKEKTIISIISSRIPNFDLSPDRMIDLKRNGVTEKVILAMLARQEGMDAFNDESWGNEEFMTGGLEPAGSSKTPADGSST